MMLLTPDAEVLIALYDAGHSLTTAQLADKLGASRFAVGRSLAKLESEHLVSTRSFGRGVHWAADPVATRETLSALVARINQAL